MNWMEDAACRGRRLDLWFPPAGASPSVTANAKRICDSGPVLIQCREYAMSNPELQGVWGSTTATDRTFIRRRRARRTAA